MKKRTVVLLSMLLCLESITFCWRFLINPYDWKNFKDAASKNDLLVRSIKELEQEVSALEKEIEELKEYPWYRERIARKELQMGYPNEEVFLF